MTKEEYTKERPLRVFTAFSGYDSQCMALDRLGMTYELIGWSEIDKYAIQAHNAVYPQWENRNFGDISKIDWSQVSDFDLFTMSSPCQDFSIAGLQKGGDEGSGTRSSLLWECRKAILAKKPRYILFENVKALMSKKFLPSFRKWQDELAYYGYSNFTKVINAKDYCVPQNRERVFMVSILDEGASFHFPEPFPLERRLKDILEEDVDERYYLSDKCVKGFMEHNRRHLEKVAEPVIAALRGTITSHYSKTGIFNIMKGFGCGDTGVIQIENILEEKGFSNPQRGRIYSADGISPTITTMAGGDLEPKIAQMSSGLEHNNHIVEVGNINPSGKGMNGRVVSDRGIAPTLSTNKGEGMKILSSEVDFRIRKLTEREVFRLMDVSEEDIDRIQNAGISRSQQYKMAGNSIVVACLYHIFRKLFIEQESESQQLTIF